MKQVMLNSEEWEIVLRWFEHLKADACDNEEDQDVHEKICDQINTGK